MGEIVQTLLSLALVSGVCASDWSQMPCQGDGYMITNKQALEWTIRESKTDNRAENRLSNAVQCVFGRRMFNLLMLRENPSPEKAKF